MRLLVKGYKLLRFMNRSHGVFLRGAFAIAAWFGALCCTRSVLLANRLSAEFWEDNFYVALRKSARFARYFCPRLDVFNDPFFDFTTDADIKELKALKKHLEIIKSKIPSEVYLTDLLYLQAAQIHFLLLQEKDASSEINTFYELANKALGKIKINKECADDLSTAEVADDFSISDARAALSDIAELLPNHEWPWYVISGTLLGLHREGRFLAHDYDIDLGINAEDIEVNVLLDRLRHCRKFTIGKLDYHCEVLGKDSQRRLRKRLSIIKLVHKNGVPIDLFIHFTEEGCCWHGSSIHRWENTPFELKEREFEGVTVLAPKNAELYLTENYGEWRIPVKDFDCTTGTPNLVVARNFISIALFIKRYSYFAQRNPKAATKLLRTMQAAQVFSLEDADGCISLIMQL